MYQETLHLLDGEKSPRQSKPSFPMATRPSPRQPFAKPTHYEPNKAESKSSNLRLDAMSLKAIAKMVDNKLVDRDYRLLGQVKALITHVGNGTSVSESSIQQSKARLPSYQFSSSTSSLGSPLSEFNLPPLTKSPERKSHGNHSNKSPREKPVVIKSDHEKNQRDHVNNSKEFNKQDVGSRVPWVRNPKSVDSQPNEDVTLRKDDIEGIRYPQCRSLVYRPTFEGDESGAATDDVVDSSSPSSTLVLKHVHAYNGDISRHGGTIRGKNVMFIGTKRIIFPAAALVVVMDIATSEQGYFSAHSEDVTCITIHPDRAIAASGQMGKDGRILIWDSSVIGPGVRDFNAAVELFMNSGIRGVCGLNFSGDGRFLVALGMDDAHSMVIFDWATAQSIATVKVGHSDVYQMGFNPYLFAAIDRIDELKLPSSPVASLHSSSTDSCCYTLISCGGRQVKFWTLRRTLERSSDDSPSNGFKGRRIALPKTKQAFSVKYVLEGNPGIFPKQKQDTPEFLCFVVVNDEDGGTGSNRYNPPKARIFTGSSNGSVYIWQHLEDDDANRAMKTLTDYSWQPRGRLLSVVTDVHDSPILDIDYTGVYSGTGEDDTQRNEPELCERIVTCSKDGIANVWKIDRSGSDRALPFEHISTINVGYSDANVESPRCVTWDLDGCTIIVGTTGNALLHLTGEGLLGTSQMRGDELQPHIFVTPVIRGHHGKIRRIASHPTEQIFASISTDRTIRLWNNTMKSQISLTKLSEKVSSIAFTPNGKALAVGTENGELMIISFGALANVSSHISANDNNGTPNEKQWQILIRRSIAAKASKSSEQPDSTLSTNSGGTSINLPSERHANASMNVKKKSELTELKFSPMGDILAVGCRDNLIHLLSVVDGYHRRAICRGHSSYIKNIDFSADGRILQSTDAVRELLYWDVATGKKIHHPSKIRDTPWYTWTCCYGWPVQGIFNGVQGTSIDSDMNAVCRSHNGGLLVAGGSSTVNSAVKLFRYPCVGKAIPSLHGGHTSPVLDVCFLANDKDVVSVGGNDASILVWAVVVPKHQY